MIKRMLGYILQGYKQALNKQKEPTVFDGTSYVPYNVPVPGINLNHDGSFWYNKEDASNNDDCQFPHCNPQVLHSPGTCCYCDKYPRSQKARTHMKVAFTNDPTPHPQGFMDCPSKLKE